MKTHEEISGFDVARLVADLGPDVVSAGLDPVNLLLNLEDPARAQARLATATSHVYLDDAVFGWYGDVLWRRLCDLGTGCVPWTAMLTTPPEGFAPSFLWVELHRGQFRVEPFDTAWLAHHRRRVQEYASPCSDGAHGLPSARPAPRHRAGAGPSGGAPAGRTDLSPGSTACGRSPTARPRADPILWRHE